MGTKRETPEGVDFSGLILGFCSAALSYLGHQSGATKNLTLAKQNIDIIELLREKTRGNLTPDESRLLEQLLTDLRLKFAEAARKT